MYTSRKAQTPRAAADCRPAFQRPWKTAAQHDHARHPEEQNVKARNQQARRIKRVEIRTILSGNFGQPKHRHGSSPEENHVSSTSVDLLQLVRSAVLALRRILSRNNDLVASRTVPRRNAMSPPQLPRDAPVMDVLHPVQVRLPVVLRRELDVAFLHRCDGLVRQRLDLHEPLRRKSRLNHGLAAVAVAHGSRDP